MRNTDLICKKLDESLSYLYKQEETLKPLIEKLQEILCSKIKTEELDFRTAFEIFYKMQEQYTNSILLITKIQEIIEFKD